jgi:hypothetical protein
MLRKIIGSKYDAPRRQLPVFRVGRANSLMSSVGRKDA